MNTRLQLAIALAAVGLSAGAITHPASACGLSLQRSVNGQWSLPAYQPSTAQNINIKIAAASQRSVSNYRNPLQFLEPITGMYEFTMIANIAAGPFEKGDVVDHGFLSWHADGTETMNSGRPAYSSNFCMGVWAQTGPRSYKLNHYALAWDFVNGQTFVGPANIREYITLAPGGASYSGNYTLDQYGQDGTTLLLHEEGPITATRITPDSN